MVSGVWYIQNRTRWIERKMKMQVHSVHLHQSLQCSPVHHRLLQDSLQVQRWSKHKHIPTPLLGHNLPNSQNTVPPNSRNTFPPQLHTADHLCVSRVSLKMIMLFTEFVFPSDTFGHLFRGTVWRDFRNSLLGHTRHRK